MASSKAKNSINQNHRKKIWKQKRQPHGLAFCKVNLGAYGNTLHIVLMKVIICQ